MFRLKIISDEMFSAIIRAITGRLFNEDQIKKITSDAVGRYFAEFFPTQRKELDAQERVESAREHISIASTILSEMQQDLEEQDKKLSYLLREVEEKKNLAERYQTLATANQKEFQAFRDEMEDALRRELIQQAEKGRRIRQAASFVIWLLTLIVGAALGAYFKEVMSWIKGIFA